MFKVLLWVYKVTWAGLASRACQPQPPYQVTCHSQVALRNCPVQEDGRKGRRAGLNQTLYNFDWYVLQ